MAGKEIMAIGWKTFNLEWGKEGIIEVLKMSEVRKTGIRTGVVSAVGAKWLAETLKVISDKLGKDILMVETCFSKMDLWVGLGVHVKNPGRVVLGAEYPYWKADLLYQSL